MGDWVKENAPWEKRRKREEKEARLRKVREEIQARMDEAEREQKELDDESPKGSDGLPERSTFEKARDRVLNWFGRDEPEEVKPEPKDEKKAPKIEREKTFKVPPRTRRVVVTITTPSGRSKSYTITNYISINSGDILHVKAL